MYKENQTLLNKPRSRSTKPSERLLLPSIHNNTQNYLGNQILMTKIYRKDLSELNNNSQHNMTLDTSLQSRGADSSFNEISDSKYSVIKLRKLSPGYPIIKQEPYKLKDPSYYLKTLATEQPKPKEHSFFNYLKPTPQPSTLFPNTHPKLSDVYKKVIVNRFETTNDVEEEVILMKRDPDEIGPGRRIPFFAQEEYKQKMVKQKLPRGLPNLGNTCYM